MMKKIGVRLLRKMPLTLLVLVLTGLVFALMVQRTGDVLDWEGLYAQRLNAKIIRGEQVPELSEDQDYAFLSAIGRGFITVDGSQDAQADKLLQDKDTRQRYQDLGALNAQHLSQASLGRIYQLLLAHSQDTDKLQAFFQGLQRQGQAQAKWYLQGLVVAGTRAGSQLDAQAIAKLPALSDPDYLAKMTKLKDDKAFGQLADDLEEMGDLTSLFVAASQINLGQSQGWRQQSVELTALEQRWGGYTFTQVTKTRRGKQMQKTERGNAAEYYQSSESRAADSNLSHALRVTTVLDTAENYAVSYWLSWLPLHLDGLVTAQTTVLQTATNYAEIERTNQGYAGSLFNTGTIQTGYSNDDYHRREMTFGLSGVLQRYDLETNGLRGYIAREYGQAALATFDQEIADLPTTDWSPNLWDRFLEVLGRSSETSEQEGIYAPIKVYFLGKGTQQLADLGGRRVTISLDFLSRIYNDDYSYDWSRYYISNNSDYFVRLTASSD